MAMKIWDGDKAGWERPRERDIDKVGLGYGILGRGDMKSKVREG
jgi:hypothetical protein